jgi:hypothetical protein
MRLTIDIDITRDAITRIDLPHVVYVYDEVLGLPTVVGPFQDPVSACAFAEEFRGQVCGGQTSEGSITLTVVALEGVDEAWISHRLDWPLRSRRSHRWMRIRSRVWKSMG